MQGILFIVSAPSGAGKSSLLRALLADDDTLVMSISHTTRAPRPGEVCGEHYHFVSEAQFQELNAAGVLLESAEVFGHFYGTADDSVRRQLAAGKDVVVEIDWQGARQVRRRFTDAVSIFILPPSIAALRERLVARKQDSDAVIAGRMRAAKNELAHYPEYEYLVINDVFATTLADLGAIVRAARLRRSTQVARQAALFHRFSDELSNGLD